MGGTIKNIETFSDAQLKTIYDVGIITGISLAEVELWNKVCGEIKNLGPTAIHFLQTIIVDIDGYAIIKGFRKLPWHGKLSRYGKLSWHGRRQYQWAGY